MGVYVDSLGSHRSVLVQGLIARRRIGDNRAGLGRAIEAGQYRRSWGDCDSVGIPCDIDQKRRGGTKLIGAWVLTEEGL